VDDSKDYEVFIDDYDPPPKDITKFQLIAIINKRIGKKWTPEKWTHEVEIDVQPEWKKILIEDGSILGEYTKLGWKAMHYQHRDQKENIKREWLSFKSLNYKGKKK